MSLLTLSHNPSSTFLKSFLFRTYWFILLPQSREPGNKLHPFTQDIKTEINTHTTFTDMSQMSHKKRFNTKASRGFNWTSLPSFHANTLDTLQHNWFLCLSERVVNYPLSVRHKKRLQRKIRSRLGWRYGWFFTDISNEWLIISTDLSNGWVWRHINCNSFVQQAAMKFDSFHQTFGTIALH